jgi:hypothetical protein
VSSVLRKHGFNVLNASSGAKGLTMLTYAPGDNRVAAAAYGSPCSIMLHTVTSSGT